MENLLFLGVPILKHIRVYIELTKLQIMWGFEDNSDFFISKPELCCDPSLALSR